MCFINRLVALATAIVCTLSISAQTTAREMWIEMPDSLCPLLTRNLRSEITEYIDLDAEPVLLNRMKTETRIDTTTADYISVKITKVSRIEIKLLRKSDAETVVCMAYTYNAPEEDTELSFWTTNWEPLDSRRFVDTNGVDCFQKPDSMTVERFEELKKYMRPRLLAIHLSPYSDELIVNPSIPLVSKEDRLLLESIVVQRKLKWNGVKFN